MEYYEEAYKDWEYNGIRFGDLVKGRSNGGIEFDNIPITTVGGGTLGVWFEDTPIEFNAENGGDTIIKESLILIKKINKNR